MKKLIGVCLSAVIMLSGLAVQAANKIDKAIKSTSINKSAISVSIRDLKTGKQVYHLNSNKPVNPASTQKLVTFAAALDTLGQDYKFSTELYKSTNNDLYFRLSGDPFLTSKDLKTLLNTAKSKNITEPKNVYIDDYIMDAVYWGEGWQWDDNLNVYMPKFGSYNLDKNLIKIIVKPTSPEAPAEIYPEVFYPIGFVNLVSTGKYDKVSLSTNQTISANLIEAKGTVKNYTTLEIPVPNIKRYFRLRLEDAFNDSKVYYYGKLYQKKLPENNIYLVDKIEHPLSSAAGSILKHSNNMTAETVFKIAGGKYINNTGSTEAAIKMLDTYLKKLNLNNENIRIVDGSGVSKNNLMTSDFMTEFLVAQTKLDNFEFFKSNMARPGIGTLTDRMLYFGENIKAKTGTLSDVSAIAGYIKTRHNNEYAFDIMINDSKSNQDDKKMAEEAILRTLYINY